MMAWTRSRRRSYFFSAAGGSSPPRRLGGFHQTLRLREREERFVEARVVRLGESRAERDRQAEGEERGAGVPESGSP
jgi:hypothetical protein